MNYVTVTDTVIADGKTDVSAAIQKLIDENPNRTLYFPDGIYLLKEPIRTPADPEKSVDLRLSNYAIIRPTADFSGGALVRLGGKIPANCIEKTGSNYGLTGGIIDGAGIADGVAIEGGRETKISNLSIKNTVCGLLIEHGANNGSSDADISDVNIVGTGKADAVGMIIKGYDNTFTNMRIGRVHTGVILKSSGNMLRNIHPLFYEGWEKFTSSTGFVDENGSNWFDYCYSDQFATAFRTVGNGISVFQNCFSFWWTDRGGIANGFVAEQKFNSVVNNFRVDFKSSTKNAFLVAKEQGGNGIISNPIFNPILLNRENEECYKTYLQGKEIHG